MPHRFTRKVECAAAVRIARCGCRYKTNNSRERHKVQLRGDTRPLGSRPVGRRTAVARGGEHRPATRHHAIRRQHGDYRRPPETVGQSGQPRPMAQCCNVVRSDRRTRGRQMVGIRNRRFHPVAVAPLPPARAVGQGGMVISRHHVIAFKYPWSDTLGRNNHRRDSHRGIHPPARTDILR